MKNENKFVLVESTNFNFQLKKQLNIYISFSSIDLFFVSVVYMLFTSGPCVIMLSMCIKTLWEHYLRLK